MDLNDPHDHNGPDDNDDRCGDDYNGAVARRRGRHGNAPHVPKCPTVPAFGGTLNTRRSRYSGIPLRVGLKGQEDVLAGYEMERHWSGVGERVRDRPSGNLLAGDVAPYYEYKAALFRELFDPKIEVEGLSVLDVGCGPGGRLRWMMEQHPRRVVGCDQSSEMVNLAKHNAPEAEVIQIDGENLPFADREFDVVTTTTVLQHNPDARRTKLLGEICRVSAKDVLLFEDTPVEMPPSTTTGTGPYQNFFGRPVGWYAGVCSCHGFEPIEIDRLRNIRQPDCVHAALGSPQPESSERGRGVFKTASCYREAHLTNHKTSRPLDQEPQGRAHHDAFPARFGEVKD